MNSLGTGDCLRQWQDSALISVPLEASEGKVRSLRREQREGRGGGELFVFSGWNRLRLSFWLTPDSPERLLSTDVLEAWVPMPKTVQGLEEEGCWVMVQMSL